MQSDKFVSIPLNQFEVPQGQETREALDRVYKSITTRPYQELITDRKAMALVKGMGADLMINTFACNFYLADGTLNTDPAEANYLNDRIYERLSLRRITDNMNLVPFILVGTIWTQEEYKDCLTKFKTRLGLRLDDSDLHTFSSVAMSPFVTDNFADEMGNTFKVVAEEEVEVCILRQYTTSWDSFSISDAGGVLHPSQFTTISFCTAPIRCSWCIFRCSTSAVTGNK